MKAYVFEGTVQEIFQVIERQGVGKSTTKMEKPMVLAKTPSTTQLVKRRGSAHNKHWNPEELEFLEQNYGKMKITRMARQLKRTIPAIHVKACALGYTTKLPWTQKSDDRLRQMVANEWSEREMAKELDRSRGAIATRIAKLGLKRQ